LVGLDTIRICVGYTCNGEERRTPAVGAKAYLRRIEEITETPIDIISTGPDRNETMILRHPFK